MRKRKNTRINTLFSNSAYDWLNQEANDQSKSLAQVVREKIEIAKKEEHFLDKFDHLEKVIKKSHSLIVDKLGDLS